MIKRFLSQIALATAVLASSHIHGATFNVSLSSDTLPFGVAGELRDALNQANAAAGSHDITFNPGINVSLNGMLPLLNLGKTTGDALTINTISSTPVTINGNSLYPGFFAQIGNINIQGITIQNTVSRGGDGLTAVTNGGGGGGGLGAGGALFINSANVNINNLTLSTNSAIGGNGTTGATSQFGGGGGGMFGGQPGAGFSPLSSGGGGGLGGNGGKAVQSSATAGGGGGGGIGPGGIGGNGFGLTGLVAATAGTSGGASGFASGGSGGGPGAPGGAGGANGGGGGGGGNFNGLATGKGAGGGGGGIAGSPGTDGSLTVSGSGGSGGFGGGGGASGGASAALASGGNGGFGGGGGGSTDLSAGNGGFGGGGGGGSFSLLGKGGNGGFGAGGGTVAGIGGVGAGDGNPTTSSASGGGAGLGGAIFVNKSVTYGGGGGTLTVSGPLTITGSAVTAGAGFKAGAAVGTALFATSGTNALTFNLGVSDTVTIGAGIADDSVNSLPGNPYNSGAGAGARLTKQGLGTLILAVDNTYAGGTELNSGILQINTSGALGLTTIPLDITGSATLRTGANLTLSYPIVITGPVATIDTNGFNSTLTGIISGSGGVSKINPGELTLTAANTYTGGTSVTDGTLFVTTASLPVATLQPSAQIGVSGELVFENASSGTFGGGILNNGLLTNDSTGTLTLAGLISGNGLTVMDGTGKLQMTATSSYTGNIEVNTGEVELIQTGTDIYTGAVNLDPSTTLSKSGVGTLTMSGNITGNGQVDVDGGTLILTSSSNNYSDGTYVNTGSTLEGNTSSLQGLIALDNGALIFNQSTDGVFSGTISSTALPSTITKTGSGVLTFNTNQNGFSGTTNIIQGGLALNSSLGGDVNVFTGTRLSGTGQILGNLNVYGGATISPGNSIGTISVFGNYTQAANSIYEVEINGSGQSDLIAIDGTASINGIIVVTSLDGILNPSLTYTILHANGGVTGTYASVISTNPVIVPTVFYTANDVLLRIDHVFSSIAITPNEEQVAIQLGSITNPTAAEQLILDELILLSSSPATIGLARKALDQMSGQQYTTLLATAEFSGHQFIRRLYDPLRSIVTTDFCSRACDEYPCSLDSWFEIGGGHTSVKGNCNTRGLDANGYEISLGVQNSLCSNWTLGLAASYAHDNVNFKVGGSSKNNTGLIAAYGLYRDSCGYVLGDLAFGYSSNKLNRPIHIGSLSYKAHSKPKIYQGVGYIEGGIDYNVCNLLVQPFLGIEAGYYNLQAIREHGADPINLYVAKKHYTSAYSRLGVHLTTTNIECYALSVDLAWQYRLTSLKNSVREHFQSFGSDFIITGVPTGRNSIDVAATISTTLCDVWEVYAEVSAQAWSKAASYSGLAGVQFNW